MSRRPALRIALALGALSACLAGPAPAAPTGNLLANPGFENTMADQPWMPAAWDTSWSGMPTVFFGRDTLVAHSGRYSVSVANVSTLIPLWHNWSQTLVVGPEMWNKDVVLSVWTRSNGVQGRAYILLQAYRDTVGKMARLWKVTWPMMTPSKVPAPACWWCTNFGGLMITSRCGPGSWRRWAMWPWPRICTAKGWSPRTARKPASWRAISGAHLFSGSGPRRACSY